jgi:hypothetical protein
MKISDEQLRSRITALEIELRTRALEIFPAIHRATAVKRHHARDIFWFLITIPLCAY